MARPMADNSLSPHTASILVIPAKAGMTECAEMKRLKNCLVIKIYKK